MACLHVRPLKSYIYVGLDFLEQNDSHHETLITFKNISALVYQLKIAAFEINYFEVSNKALHKCKLS